jgi:hypothetical protein
MENPKWKIVSRGLCSWNAKDINCSSSGGSFEQYVKEAEEGAFVYDAYESDRKSFYDLIMRGPMCSPELPLGTVERFGEDLKKSAKMMLPGLSGGYEVFVKEALSDSSYTGLDKVAIDLYKELLKKIPGMRTGYVRNGSVVWE